ncbi:erythromycin esterase family protein [Kitasatospora sp. NPDC054939]
MTQDIRDLMTVPWDLLGLGEPTHREPGFALLRNELFAQLADRGFRSIALETDRVAALVVDDYVREGAGSLGTAMREGFSHGFGEWEANRRLVAWMRAYNRDRAPEERLAFHGFDIPTENTSAPSPRSYLEHARDHLGLDHDIAGPAGPDERWSRPEAVLDPAASPGATGEAERLRAIGEDLLDELYARAPERIAATSRTAWSRARIHLTAGLQLLRYHRESAVPREQPARVARLLAVRDLHMARNLLDLRRAEADRGPTLVHAHNLHLQRTPSTWRMGDTDLDWNGAGAIVGALLGERYGFVAGSLGRSAALGLGEPAPDTPEGLLQRRFTTWGLTVPPAVGDTRPRTDTTPAQGYFPLDRAVLDTADALLHLADGAAPIGR